VKAGEDKAGKTGGAHALVGRIAVHSPRLLFAALLSLLAGAPGPGAQPVSPAPAGPSLTGAKPLPLTGERRAAFEAYIADAIHRFGVPGAEVAVVADGEVVYLNAFGVREMGSTRPVTPDTMMMIGSITKSMTTMLAASLVDEGKLAWDTPLVDLLPDFAVGDAGLTERLTVRDAFCNCSGVPALNIQSSFESGRLTPGNMAEALADVAPSAPYGEAFIYNNILIASGGYALGIANGGAAGDVGLAYDTALRERVLGPIGMTRSTFDPDMAMADGDYALPHATDLSGNLKRIPLTAERGLLPYRPAGALWSNAREMARYLQTELARGVAPGGTRVVSAENLETTWAPGVSMPNLYQGPPEMAATMTRYGLGWMDGEYRGLRIVSHAGGSAGFTAKIAFLPEAGLGIVVLSNSFSLRPIPLAFEYAVEFRLLELLFDQPAEFDAQLTAQGEVLADLLPGAALGKVDPAAIAPYLGGYDNDELGEVSLTLRGERLVLDAGELSSELRPRADAGAEAVYLLHDPPLSLFSEAYAATVTFAGGADAPRMTISVPASVTGPEESFTFTPRN
jgi:CubicO group peptidase (beta-lactamase class C family)